MDWSNERYVRVYTRDTTTWKLLDWRGKTVLSLLFRHVDRAGVLDVGHDGVLGLAAVLELPIEIAEAGIRQLTASRGGQPTVVDTGTAYVLPNFLAAQEAPSSDPQRKRESRARRRDLALAVSRNLLITDGSGQSESAGHETGRLRDENTEPVTPCLAVPIPDLPPARAIPPSTAPVPAAPAPPPGERIEARQLWRELEQARGEAAAALGVQIQPLTIGDAGERDLAGLLVAARSRGPDEIAKLVSQARHAIAMAKLETVRGEKSLEWFSGAVFAPNNFRRLAAKTSTLTARAGPGRSAERAPPQSIRPKHNTDDDPPLLKQGT